MARFIVKNMQQGYLRQTWKLLESLILLERQLRFIQIQLSLKRRLILTINGLLTIFVIRHILQRVFIRQLLMSELVNEKLSTLRAVFRVM